MSGTAYGDATQRQVADMQIRVPYSEEYKDPNAEIWAYTRGGGCRPRPPDYNGPNGLH